MDQLPSGMVGKSASAYEHLKRLAIGGHLRPDRRLSPTDLATQFQVSVTPVREALVRLGAEGFIRGEGGRGYFTRRFVAKEQADLRRLLFTTFVIGLEDALEAAAEPARRETLRGLERLDAATSGEGAHSADAYLEAAEAVLLGPCEIAAAEVTTLLLRNALERTHYVRRLDYEDAPHRRRAAAWLRQTAGAMLAGDLPRAMETRRAFTADLRARLPQVVEQANAQIAARKFP